MVSPKYSLAASNLDDTAGPAITSETWYSQGIPAPQRALVLVDYVFQAGDTLVGLAKQFHVSLESIVSINGQPEVGQRLKIPSFNVLAHIVKRTDELRDIAEKYGVGVYAICQTNGISPQSVLTHGMTLYVPIDEVYYPGQLNLFRGEVYIRTQEGNDHYYCLMNWPVQGAVSGRFGERRSTGTHHGLDIAAPKDQIIIAPRAGQVVRNMRYEGLLGNALYIDHGNGLMTLYGHLSEALVLGGTWVEAGQPIARVGDNGRSTGSHLHFGVFVDGEAYDPLMFLGG